MVANTILGVIGTTGRPLTEHERLEVDESVKKAWAGWTEENELGGFLTRRFQRAALRVLVAHGGPRDVRFARQFAESADNDLRIESIRLLDRFGTSYDSDAAVQLATRVYGDERQVQAAEIALRLAFMKDKLAVLDRLRETPSLAGWSTSRLADIDKGVWQAINLLRSKNSTVRSSAASVVWDWVAPDHADALLTLYMTRGQHFYNVVRKIDRRLYAPDWLRSALPD